jgi:hypothetical protein
MRENIIFVVVIILIAAVALVTVIVVFEQRTADEVNDPGMMIQGQYVRDGLQEHYFMNWLEARPNIKIIKIIPRNGKLTIIYEE